MNVQTNDHYGNAGCHIRLEAHPIGRMRDRDNGRIIGLVYQWNTGETQLAWFGQVSHEFDTEPLT